MKKNLLATTALVAAGALASTGAFAESKPIKLNVGGYYEQWVGVIFQDSDKANNHVTNADGLDVQEDGEIHFEGSTTLDNGLTFGVNVQLEASTSGDQIDENYLFVRGDFGEILLGSENGPAYAMHYGIDNDKGYGLEEGDTGLYWFNSGTHWNLHTTRPAQIDNDSQKIRWMSPRFSGVQIGLSYAPEARDDQDSRIPNEAANDPAGFDGIQGNTDDSWGADGIKGTADDAAGAREDIMAAGINFDQKFGDVRVRASAVGEYVGDYNGDVDGTADAVWSAATGLRIGVSGFDFAIAYKHTEGESFAGGDNTKVIGAGVAYTSGPVGVSLTGAHGWVSGGREAKQTVVQLGAGYALGPGVSVNATAVYAESTNLLGAATDFSGFGVVGGIKLNF